MMLRVALAALAVLLASGPAAAQGWPYSSRSPYYEPPSRYYNYPPPRQYGYFSNFGWDGYDYRPSGPRVQSGGGKPAITPIPAQRISFASTYPVDSVIIDHRGRQLLLVVSEKEALRYPISVGREGFSWTGTETISRVAEWPDWHPPEEMRDRDPSLPEKMTGGVKNPLGAKALYLGKTLYRIHGTNDAKSIGKAASSGCFRMLNGHVVDLASRVKIGTAVTVVTSLPPELDRIVSQQVPRQPVATERTAETREPPPRPRDYQYRRRPPPSYWYGARDPYWDDD